MSGLPLDQIIWTPGLSASNSVSNGSACHKGSTGFVRLMVKVPPRAGG